jgi:hypothetical protein
MASSGAPGHRHCSVLAWACIFPLHVWMKTTLRTSARTKPGSDSAASAVKVHDKHATRLTVFCRERNGILDLSSRSGESFLDYESAREVPLMSSCGGFFPRMGRKNWWENDEHRFDRSNNLHITLQVFHEEYD